MTVTILRAGTLLLADDAGDIEGSGSAGLYVGDTRLLSRWVLRIAEARPRVAGELQEASRRMVALLLPGRRHDPSPVFVRRDQRVSRRGLLEALTVQNVARHQLEVIVSVEVGCDFADQFAVRADGREFDTAAAERSGELIDAGAYFTYRHARDGRLFTAAARITASPAPAVLPPRSGATTLTWTLSLDPGQSQEVEIQVERADAADPCAAADPSAVLMTTTPAPSGQLSQEQLESLRRRSLADLDALLVPSPVDPHRSVIGAGAPWFLTLFGRDSLLTAELLSRRAPGMAGDVLRALAATQGRMDDSASLEQPGRIVHEVRGSELATLGIVPYGRYYGTVDATPLFLVVLGRAAARPGGRELAGELEPAARAAIAWIRGPGGLEEHGFLRYTPDPNGLINQGWRDAKDSTVFADGSLATGPISLCEVQGYTWEALTAAARLARDIWGAPGDAAELQDLADALRARFLTEFWLAERDYPALALDGAGAQVDAIASAAGHLLWSGLLPHEKAAAVVDRLLAPDLFTGWGLRTVAAGQAPYTPLSYHSGSVWPHDTMLAALGMARYGFLAQARILAGGVAAAGHHLDDRLPELFAGFSQADVPFPVRLPFAGLPQAWAAAAGVAAVDLLLP